jgi:predicted 3-demethylubiquinone-9 3-methyltransferase (glyoxalase superfamily)
MAPASSGQITACLWFHDHAEAALGCGGLTDEFGLIWLAVPRELPALFSRGPGVLNAGLKMN